MYSDIYDNYVDVFHNYIHEKYSSKDEFWDIACPNDTSYTPLWHQSVRDIKQYPADLKQVILTMGSLFNLKIIDKNFLQKHEYNIGHVARRWSKSLNEKE